MGLKELGNFGIGKLGNRFNSKIPAPFRISGWARRFQIKAISLPIVIGTKIFQFFKFAYSILFSMQVYRYLFFILGAMLIQQQLSGQSISAEHNYARNCPGIVRVEAVFSATVYVNKVDINQRVFGKLVDSVKKIDTTGKIFSPEQKLDMVVKALYKSPLRFFSSSGEYFRQAHRVQSTGTGFLITGDGYLVTNCHIIDRDSAFIRNKFILSTFQEVTESNINSLQSSWAMTLTNQQRDLLYNAYGLIYSQVSSMILFDLKREFFVLYRLDTDDKGIVTVKKKANVVVKGRPMPGKDVAILKIEAVEDMPTLSLSNDSLVRIGTEALVFGYPEPVTSNSFLAADASIDPSLTAGIVSAIKKSIGGWPVIQMDAMISHGSSGSPVCNDKGEVIGLATFGSLDQGSGSLASGFNFAIPVSVVKEFIDSAHLEPAQSKVSVLFNQALQFFYQQYYSKAKDRFDEVKNINNTYPQVNFYISQCKSKIARGADRQSPPRKYVFWVMVVIAVLTGGYIFYKSRQRNR
jgi:serine protease Do